jgi:esterase/lipase superfamily enzyme
VHREYHRWRSERLDRDMELLLFGHGGEPVLLFPTSRGRFHQNEDFGLIGALADRIDAGRYVVLCVDGVDDQSWYDVHKSPRDRVATHERYESYVIEEAVPFLRSKSSGGRLTLGGCSFGGFHAVQIGLRHPRLAQRILSMSGKFETEGFLDGYHDERVYFHSVFQWLPNLTDAAILEDLFKLEIILATGDRDFCKASNERLSALLWSKGIGNHLSIWRDADHDWPVWKQQIREYLPR